MNIKLYLTISLSFLLLGTDKKVTYSKCFNSQFYDAYTEILITKTNFYEIGRTDITSSYSFGEIIQNKKLKSFLDPSGINCIKIESSIIDTIKSGVIIDFIPVDIPFYRQNSFVPPIKLNRDLNNEFDIIIIHPFGGKSNCQKIKTKDGIAYRFHVKKDLPVKNIHGKTPNKAKNYHKAYFTSIDFIQSRFYSYSPKEDSILIQKKTLYFNTQDFKYLLYRCKCSKEIKKFRKIIDQKIYK